MLSGAYQTLSDDISDPALTNASLIFLSGSTPSAVAYWFNGSPQDVQSSIGRSAIANYRGGNHNFVAIEVEGWPRVEAEVVQEVVYCSW